MVKRQNFANLAPSKVLDLNTPSDSVIELPKSYRMNVLVLKMITLNSNYGLSKIAIKIREIPKAIAHGTKAKIGRFDFIAEGHLFTLHTTPSHVPLTHHTHTHTHAHS